MTISYNTEPENRSSMWSQEQIVQGASYATSINVTYRVSTGQPDDILEKVVSGLSA